MHWFCIFLTTDCSYFCCTSTEGKERNMKIAQAFSSYMKGRLKISTEALKHLLLYKRQCSDSPIVCFSSSWGFKECSTAPVAVGQIPHGKAGSCRGRERGCILWVSTGRDGHSNHFPKCISRNHNCSFHQPCLTLFLIARHNIRGAWKYKTSLFRAKA